jgi:mycothiol system anti-sigma-R factor
MADCGPECQEILREIEAYLDHEIDDVQRLRVQAHLGDCGPCGDRADFQQHLRDLVRGKCGEQLPVGLEDRLRSLLDEPAG